MKKKASHFNITACCEKNTVGDPDTRHSPPLLLATNCSRSPFRHKLHEAMASSLGDKLRLILQKKQAPSISRQARRNGPPPERRPSQLKPKPPPHKVTPWESQGHPGHPFRPRMRPQSEVNPSPKGPTLRAHTKPKAHVKPKGPR